MRTILFLALALAALPAVAIDPPAPPPVTWVVDGYKALGLQWVKQPDHCLKTTDLKQAGEYEAELLRFTDWIAVSNIPAVCTPAPDQWERPTAMVSPTPHPRPQFLVWAFHQIDGKWVKDEKYCWASGDTYTCRIDALAYAKKVNAVPGWRATTNAPEAMYAHPNDAIAFHGPLDWNNGYSIRFSLGGIRHTSETYHTNGGSYDYRGLSETNGGWSRHGFRVPSDAERRRIHDSIYEENQRNFQQSMDDFNRSMQNQ